MKMVEGRIFWDAAVPGVFNMGRVAIFDAMNVTMAQLHSVDYEAVGLGDYGRPGNDFELQTGRWSKQYLDNADARRDPKWTG